jgi:uncharacterized membrane protein
VSQVVKARINGNCECLRWGYQSMRGKHFGAIVLLGLLLPSLSLIIVIVMVQCDDVR